MNSSSNQQDNSQQRGTPLLTLETIGEYVGKDGQHTNTAESYFAILKRGVMGSFHHVSKKHLHRYCDEFAFRWNERTVTDAERRDAAVKGGEGKRLMYRDPVSNRQSRLCR